MKKLTILILLILLGCTQNNEYIMEGESMPDKIELATFAGGCFWCTEYDLEKLPGVVKVISGFAGGKEENPSYKEVASGNTGHTESVQVTYDPDMISYKELLDVFWRNHDPTDNDGQFVDRGKQYRPAIFYHNQTQKKIAERSKLEIAKHFDKPIVTEITEYTGFYVAEDYHQDYGKKNPVRYKFYRSGSGRDQFLEKTWPAEEEEEEDSDFVKPSKEELKKKLTSLQYEVTQEDGTERPFENEYWDNKEDGIYVDIVSGEPLFSSKDKFVSGTGWPSFTKPLEDKNIVKKKDYKLILPRTEIRSKSADSHIGHLFNDGPAPTGLRYCMNSAALRFIPKKDLEKEGYGQYLELFKS